MGREKQVMNISFVRGLHKMKFAGATKIHITTFGLNHDPASFLALLYVI
jgi:hypothetical protein